MQSFDPSSALLLELEYNPTCFRCPSRLLQVWIVYHSKMKTKQVYLQDSTYATPFSLMLWGAHVRHERPLGKKHAVDVVIGERRKIQRYLNKNDGV